MKRFSSPRPRVRLPRSNGWNKPYLETLEDRAAPGDTVLGGLTLGILGGSALTWQGQAQAVSELALTQSIAHSLSFTSPANQIPLQVPAPTPDFQAVVAPPGFCPTSHNVCHF
jgi:hypothetical protein